MTLAVDRTRRFELPGIQDLNKDQEAALDLPLDGQSLIIGGPGTGKSVVALLRARRLSRSGKDYQFLVYNHMLDHSNRRLFGTGAVLESRTWTKWFWDTWSSHFGSRVPLQPAEKLGDYRPFDWDKIAQKVQEDGTPMEAPPTLVIDEGQDMPPAFYATLLNLGFANFYVVADQNQSISEGRNSSRKNIEDSLCIDTPNTLELKINYRNCLPIARLAQHFYTNDPASPPPELPRRASLLTPVLMRYDEPDKPPLRKLAERILLRSNESPRKLWGIITPNDAVRTKFFNILESARREMRGEFPPLFTYYSGSKEIPDFGGGGVVVLNAQSCKGLEFESVILADVDAYKPKENADHLRSLFYVMVSRAREQVVMLRTGPVCPVVDALLPDDPAILSRK